MANSPIKVSPHANVTAVTGENTGLYPRFCIEEVAFLSSFQYHGGIESFDVLHVRGNYQRFLDCAVCCYRRSGLFGGCKHVETTKQWVPPNV